MGIRNLTSASIASGTKRSKFFDPNSVLEGYSLIKSTTLTAPAGTVIMSSILQGYSHIEIVAYTICDSGTSFYGMRFNNDSTSGNYTYQQASSTIASSTSNATLSASFGTADQAYLLNTSSITAPAITKAFITEYSSSTKTKLFISHSQAIDGGASAFYRNGTWTSTAGINSISFVNTGGAFQAGTTFAIYGIK